jgi:methylase of polypeptide subunit release factors
LVSAGIDNLNITGFDISETAIKLSKENPMYVEPRINTFVLNALKEDFEVQIKDKNFDFISMVFFLSAMDPD